MSTTNSIFEAKYLAIKWADRESALSITESKNSLPIEVGDTTHFSIEAITFSKLNDGQFGQLGFRIIDGSIDQQIYFLKTNGDKVNLKPVLDNLTKQTWWVEAEEWSKSNRRWQSEIFRTSGSILLHVGSYNCQIKIGSCSFSYEQLSDYLQDFKNDLWYLALHETSYISAPAKEKAFDILDESSIKYFNSLIEFAENIVKKPKSELREIQELKSIKKVKPLPRTFMEIATKGYKTQLTSRAYKSSYNVPENKYVLFVVNRIFNLLSNLGKVSNYIATSLQEKINNQEERITSFTDTIEINRNAVKSDYDELKSKLIDERELLSQALSSQISKDIPTNYYVASYTLTLGKKLERSSALEFFHIAGLEDLNKPKYYRIKFEDNFEHVFKEYRTYKIKGKISYYIDDNYAHKLTFHYIDTLEIVGSDIEVKLYWLTKHARSLSENNWKRPIKPRERKEQEQEIIAIKSLIDSASIGLENNNRLSIKLIPTLSKIRDLRKRIIELKIEPDSLFPNSMSFIQNPNYQGVHKLYKKIQTLSGLDENVFKGLEDSEDIGILNTSLIYERWCLLQIIKVLIDKFGFMPEENWKNKLLNQIINLDPKNVRNVLLKFENLKINRSLTLWYEKEFPVNDKGGRPRADFVIDLTSNFNENENTLKRLVLDAKFYENIAQMGGISKVIDQLYNVKNYSESSKNKVFILHPSLQSVPTIKTPQEWSKNSFFGESKLFDWDDEYPNHQYGALLLSPIQNKGNYADNLQMCIGMFLQYGIEENGLDHEDYDEQIRSDLFIEKEEGINPLVCAKAFCLVCGSDDQHLRVDETKYKNGLKWTQTCNQCRHITYYNYCINGSCRNRLIKHGPYWTYHATQSMQPYNIKCPNCGEIVVDVEDK